VAAITRDRAAGKRIGFIPLSFDLLKIADVRGESFETVARATTRNAERLFNLTNHPTTQSPDQ